MLMMTTSTISKTVKGVSRITISWTLRVIAASSTSTRCTAKMGGSGTPGRQVTYQTQIDQTVSLPMHGVLVTTSSTSRQSS